MARSSDEMKKELQLKNQQLMQEQQHNTLLFLQALLKNSPALLADVTQLHRLEVARTQSLDGLASPRSLKVK